MSQLDQLHEVTSELYKHVQQPPKSIEREDFIEKLSELLDKRERLIKDLEGPYTDEEHEKGQEIIRMNGVVDNRVSFHMKQLKTEIAHMKKRKTSNQRYTNPYQNVSTYDGTFLDKKK
ncbi:flagellar protein [Pontibacillus chungwhensis BH030062]|uniref:Flagellar protein FliT n=1 Tax=Pontibacillus chungwhensis BH030062 TaxID=1385513 RepID=A0A0A2UY17_9BACI|nr:flagellar protein FliT [Pontibacillus chungwhensis]KGP91391.1 flagellar protein [Pontibacillus chungwhensis BH030062]